MSDIDDLVQEAFLQVWRKRDTFQGGSGFRAWLYRIATNACLDAVRCSARQVPSPGSFAEVPWLQPYPDRLLNEVAPSDADPDIVVIARETSAVYARNPQRFLRKHPEPPELPAAARINKPPEPDPGEEPAHSKNP